MMSKQARKPTAFIDVPNAPIVYFDVAAAQGVLNGTIQVELATRTMEPIPNTRDVVFKFVACGRLRCSPAAARMLRDSLNAALKMLEPSNSQPKDKAAAGQLN